MSYSKEEKRQRGLAAQRRYLATLTPEQRARKNLVSGIRMHGVTVAWFEEQALKGCAICGSRESAGGARLHIDHDHSHRPGASGCPECVRGVLCNKCNTGLGGFRDDVPTMLLAVAYPGGSR